MHILITGGSGFLGGRLADAMVKSGHKVFISSRNLSGVTQRLPEAISRYIDWNNQDSIVSACSKIEIIIHAAGFNSLECEADPISALSFNGVATARLVQAAISSGVGRLIYLSTAHVYQADMKGMIDEGNKTINIHPYATSKLAAESAVLAANFESRIDGVVLRLSNIYGAPIHKNVKFWNLLIPSLCKQVIESGEIRIFSNGGSYRDFLDATSFCRMVEEISSINLASVEARVFNLGSGVAKSLLEVATTIADRCNYVLGFKPRIICETTFDDGSSSLIYSTERLKSIGINFYASENHSEIDHLLTFCAKNFSRIRV
jgi:UDP-glucose 4-epimerase